MKTKFRKGIASFYIVTFTTLILTIMTASFAVVMVSETTRTSNDDLSQSAYDAALAGVEDAKLAYANYQRCKTDQAEHGGTTILECGGIIDQMENPPSCDMVGRMAGRMGMGDTGEVLLQETSTTGSPTGDNNMNQAYTCVKIDTNLDSYLSTLSTDQRMRVVRGIFNDADAINSIKLSWYTNRPDATYIFNNVSGSDVIFKDANNLSKPPVLEVQIVQTDTSFTMEEILSVSKGDTTDRATLFLVPHNASGSDSISVADVAATNDRKIKKDPFPIRCNDNYASGGNAFACSVTIELPKPIAHNGGTATRNNDTFAIMIALPYGEPDTDFSLQLCGSGGCDPAAGGGGAGDIISIQNLQVEIDSTGRANDLYRRVLTRLETTDIAFAYPYYALQLLEDGNVAKKNMTVVSEHDLYDQY